jgi:EpsI family protein
MIARPTFFGPVVVIAIIGAVIGGFWLTFSNLVGFTENAEGSTHTTFVLAAFLVLLWGARTDISTLPIRPFPPGILGLLVAGLIWLAGELVFARVLTHIGIIVMIPMTILTILGSRWLAALSFPLAFLLLAIPVGGSIVPTLVDWTATFAVAGLQASGIPVHREGAYLIVPSGAWSVADSCSGIAYLRTVTMLSILYAWSMYRFFPKRMAFIAGGILIGITGNWLRAYLTILIAHLSDNRFLRDDHSTFGWVLFAVLLFAYCAIGYRYRDGEQSSTSTEVKQPASVEQSKTQSRSLYLAGVVLAALVALAVWPILQRTLQGGVAVAPVEISDVAPARGWAGVTSPAVSWAPTLTNPSRQRVQSFEKDGRRVDVFIGVFQNQTWTSKLVTVVNGFALQDNPRWSLAVRGTAKIEFAGQPLDVETGVILGSGTRILAWRWYWIHGTSTASDAQAKIAQLMARLRSLADTSAWMSVYADATASPNESAELLDQFMREMGPSVQQSLVATAR